MAKKNHGMMKTIVKTNGNPVLDYPVQGDTISGRDYTVRISAPEGTKLVEVAVDQGQWKPCRQAAGYWWYDWSGYEAGEHEIVARSNTPEGRTLRSEPHEFLVALPGAPKLVKN